MQNKGEVFENVLFGCNAKQWREPKKLNFANAVLFVEEVQALYFNWNPACPSTELALRLFKAVQQYTEPCVRARLRLFVAIGTSLDRHHRTDAFFRIEGTPRIALIDAKARRVGASEVLKRPRKMRKLMLPKLRAHNKVLIFPTDFEHPKLLNFKAWQIEKLLSWEDERLLLQVDSLRPERRLDEQLREQDVNKAKTCAPSLQLQQEMVPKQSDSSRLPEDKRVIDERIQDLRRVLGL